MTAKRPTTPVKAVEKKRDEKGKRKEDEKKSKKEATKEKKAPAAASSERKASPSKQNAVKGKAAAVVEAPKKQGPAKVAPAPAKK